MPCITFRSTTEATLWNQVFLSLCVRGCAKEYAAGEADGAVISWRERNPHNYEVDPTGTQGGIEGSK